MTFDSRWKNPQGGTLQQIYLWAQDLIKELRKGTFLDFISGEIADAIASKAEKSQAWSESLIIEVADNKDYRFVDWAFGWTITSVVTRSLVGTCTLQVSINGTPLGGSANSVSTTEQTQTHASANVLAPGDDLVITISANADAEGVSCTLKGTRVLA